MRNIENQRKQAKEIIRKHQRLDITVEEITAFYDSFKENMSGGLGNSIYKLAADAYYMGLAVGYRNGKKARNK